MRDLAPLKELLISGGDERISLNMEGRNRYGYAPVPDSDELAFSSSTASTISEDAFAAAFELYQHIGAQPDHKTDADIYEDELSVLKADFLRLSGLDQQDGLDLICAASGTDIHLIMAHLLAGSYDQPLMAITVEACETGSGIIKAMNAQHFMSTTSGGAKVNMGAEVSFADRAQHISVPARDADGQLRDRAEIEAKLDVLIDHALDNHQKVLLVVADVTKTGLISPEIPTVMRLHEKYGQRLMIMVDACQFRLSKASLKAYVDHGFFVALTGSKFLSGPPFSGLLLVPRPWSQALKHKSLPPQMADYTAQAEWPQNWAVRRYLPQRANFGLLLRLKAALYEYEAFCQISETQHLQIMSRFQSDISRHIAEKSRFEAIETRPLDRTALVAGTYWDQRATIFAFALKDEGGEYLTSDALNALYNELSRADVDRCAMRLGQAVECGEVAGQKRLALRLCFSARLSVYSAHNEHGLDQIIAKAKQVLDHIEQRLKAQTAEFNDHNIVRRA